MSRLAVWFLGCAVGASVPAQTTLSLSQPDTVVPRGYGALHGAGTGSTWSAEKSRRVVLIDRAQFPWGAGNPYVLHGFRLRRAGGVVVEMASTQRTIRVRGSATRATPGSSTPVGPTAAQASTTLDANHGAATPTLCLSGTVPFPPRGRLLNYYQSCAVPFVDGDPGFPVVTFTTPLVIPADADTVVLDIEIETSQSGAFANYRWQPDEVGTFAQPEYRGGWRRLSLPCPTPVPGPTPCELTIGTTTVSDACLDRCNASGLNVGAVFTTNFRVGKTGEWMFAWLGALHPLASYFAGVACPNFVDPGGSILVLGISSDSNGTAMTTQWGTIPNHPLLVGLQVGVQFAAYDPSSTTLSPDGAALSGVYELTIGPAPVGDIEYRTLVAVCDQTGSLGLIPDPPSCAGFDPFAPGAQGVVGDTPVLQLF
ncbi:MAG: hypothetical protein JNL08_07920 [Planctomycetes bacterium]|nr:hypothetical protein [Planctomycetota bacterium]